jgi:UDP-N-acetylglucosamine 4,6-dehydratase
MKQVPISEKFPFEAVKTNILGSWNVGQAAINCKLKNVVALSTDKAAHPTNSMGLTKGLMEKLMLHFGSIQSETRFNVTRYGNVLKSRGSVVPLFTGLIASGREVSITDPNMTRFILTLEDAIDLVLLALADDSNGSIYVKKAESATVLDLAEAVARSLDKQLKYNVVGNRPGEKIHEVLLTADEIVRSEDLGDYYRVLPQVENTLRSETAFNDLRSCDVKRLSVERLVDLIKINEML